MSTANKLAYPVATVQWNGKVVTRLPDESFIPTLKILKKHGITEVMLTGYVTVENSDFDMMEETKRIGDLLASMGMKPSQHHGLAAMFAPEGENQDQVIEKLIRSIRYTANLNAGVLVIHPGHVDMPLPGIDDYRAYFEKLIQKDGRDAVLGLCAENLAAAENEAEKAGVKIAVENVHLFESDITLMQGLLAKANSTNIGFCMDSGHANYKCPDVLKWLDLFASRLITTHFHDNNNRSDEHLPPGFGTIPWIDVIKKLREIGYHETITFESGPWPFMDMERGYEYAINYWRILEQLS